MVELKVQKKSSFGGGIAPELLVHQSNDPHFTPIFVDDGQILISLETRWKEVIEMIPDGEVYFEVLKGTQRIKKLGIVSKINTDENIPITYNGLSSFDYELFVVDDSGKKIWSTGKRRLSQEGNKNNVNTGWCEIVADPSLDSPFKYQHDVSADRPVITMNKTLYDIMMNRRSCMYPLIQHSYFVHVLSIYLSNSSDPSTWLNKTLDSLLKLQPSEGANSVDEFLLLELENKLDWLQDVSQQIFIDKEGLKHIEQLESILDVGE